MTKLEEKNDLDFIYREKFSKFNPLVADMYCQQAVLNRITTNYSLNKELLDDLDIKSEAPAVEVENRLRSIVTSRGQTKYSK